MKKLNNSNEPSHSNKSSSRVFQQVVSWFGGIGTPIEELDIIRGDGVKIYITKRGVKADTLSLLSNQDVTSLASKALTQ
ncbi:hypothetical protein Q4602_12605 [Paraglaciecola chathamensis]|uniref:hypothetical protein n=1 Tax=Paraglaciecola chathamensis TaxID=368405 RepID=UPI0026FDFF8C|nr:hypothetical protein [Paraglaciecola chathamensis]MDO6840317.1 hypothetical protein [Paraglaciecola chathamensis]